MKIKNKTFLLYLMNGITIILTIKTRKLSLMSAANCTDNKGKVIDFINLTSSLDLRRLLLIFIYSHKIRL
jgi:hypothetical protein